MQDTASWIAKQITTQIIKGLTMKISTLFLVALSLSVTALPSVAEVTIEHAQGTAIFTQTPSKVITFDLASLDTLDALNVEVLGLPQAFASGSLKKYKSANYINAGSLFEPDLEVIAAQQPDLVIVATRSAKAYKSLSALAPTIDLSIWGANYLEQFKATSTKIAQIFNRQEELKSKLDDIDTQVAQIQQLAKSAGNALFILTNGGKISAYGPGSRFGWLHDDLGITPAIADIKAATHGDPISFEFILKTDPDWIFVLDRDAAIGKGSGAAKALLDNELINKSKAAQNRQIVYLNGANWYILAGGVNAVAASVTEVLTALKNSH
ncbi:MAG: hypothetical protein OFPI_16730 [Osedax symbiont Rs2]|nr:MAG: hypothetical protein OFPI_16730 [Osedax symbiont Rs2]